MTKPPRILLTGRPGCGKTTAIQRTVKLIGSDRCVGFYTEERRERGRRLGFDVVTLEGRRGPLARAGASGPRVGRYGVDVHSFEALGVASLEHGLNTGALLLVIDEIGKMELFSERFVGLLGRLFDPEADWAVLGTVMRGRHRQVDRLQVRPDVEVIQVTPANRGDLPMRLSEVFSSFLSSKGSGACG